jgi:hypothetical protein
MILGGVVNELYARRWRAGDTLRAKERWRSPFFARRLLVLSTHLERSQSATTQFDVPDPNAEGRLSARRRRQRAALLMPVRKAPAVYKLVSGVLGGGQVYATVRNLGIRVLVRWRCSECGRDRYICVRASAEFKRREMTT